MSATYGKTNPYTQRYRVQLQAQGVDTSNLSDAVLTSRLGKRLESEGRSIKEGGEAFAQQYLDIKNQPDPDMQGILGYPKELYRAARMSTYGTAGSMFSGAGLAASRIPYVGEQIGDWMMDRAEDLNAASGEKLPTITRPTEVRWNKPDEAIRGALSMFGQAGPSLAEGIVVGRLGGVGSRAVGKVLSKRIPEGRKVTRKVKGVNVQRDAREDFIDRVEMGGMVAATAINSIGLNAGEIYNSLYPSTQLPETDPDYVDLDTARNASMLGGLASGSLDWILPATILQKFLRQTGPKGKQYWTRFVQSLPSSVTIEGATEGAQELINMMSEKYARGEDMSWRSLSTDEKMRLIDAGALGAVGGAQGALISALAEPEERPLSPAQQQEITDAINQAASRKQENLDIEEKRAKDRLVKLFNKGDIIRDVVTGKTGIYVGRSSENLIRVKTGDEIVLVPINRASKARTEQEESVISEGDYIQYTDTDVTLKGTVEKVDGGMVYIQGKDFPLELSKVKVLSSKRRSEIDKAWDTLSQKKRAKALSKKDNKLVEKIISDGTDISEIQWSNESGEFSVHAIDGGGYQIRKDSAPTRGVKDKYAQEERDNFEQLLRDLAEEKDLSMTASSVVVHARNAFKDGLVEQGQTKAIANNKYRAILSQLKSDGLIDKDGNWHAETAGDRLAKDLKKLRPKIEKAHKGLGDLIVYGGNLGVVGELLETGETELLVDNGTDIERVKVSWSEQDDTMTPSKEVVSVNDISNQTALVRQLLEKLPSEKYLYMYEKYLGLTEESLAQEQERVRQSRQRQQREEDWEMLNSDLLEYAKKKPRKKFKDITDGKINLDGKVHHLSTKKFYGRLREFFEDHIGYGDKEYSDALEYFGGVSSRSKWDDLFKTKGKKQYIKAIYKLLERRMKDPRGNEEWQLSLVEEHKQEEERKARIEEESKRREEEGKKREKAAKDEAAKDIILTADQTHLLIQDISPLVDKMSDEIKQEKDGLKDFIRSMFPSMKDRSTPANKSNMLTTAQAVKEHMRKNGGSWSDLGNNWYEDTTWKKWLNYGRSHMGWTRWDFNSPASKQRGNDTMQTILNRWGNFIGTWQTFLPMLREEFKSEWSNDLETPNIEGLLTSVEEGPFEDLENIAPPGSQFYNFVENEQVEVEEYIIKALELLEGMSSGLDWNEHSDSYAGAPYPVLKFNEVVGAKEGSHKVAEISAEEFATLLGVTQYDGKTMQSAWGEQVNFISTKPYSDKDALHKYVIRPNRNWGSDTWYWLKVDSFNRRRSKIDEHFFVLLRGVANRFSESDEAGVNPESEYESTRQQTDTQITNPIRRFRDEVNREGPEGLDIDDQLRSLVDPQSGNRDYWIQYIKDTLALTGDQTYGPEAFELYNEIYEVLDMVPSDDANPIAPVGPTTDPVVEPEPDASLSDQIQSKVNEVQGEIDQLKAELDDILKQDPSSDLSIVDPKGRVLALVVEIGAKHLQKLLLQAAQGVVRSLSDLHGQWRLAIENIARRNKNYERSILDSLEGESGNKLFSQSLEKVREILSNANDDISKKALEYLDKVSDSKNFVGVLNSIEDAGIVYQILKKAASNQLMAEQLQEQLAGNPESNEQAALMASQLADPTSSIPQLVSAIKDITFAEDDVAFHMAFFGKAMVYDQIKGKSEEEIKSNDSSLIQFIYDTYKAGKISEVKIDRPAIAQIAGQMELFNRSYKFDPENVFSTYQVSHFNDKSKDMDAPEFDWKAIGGQPVMVKRRIEKGDTLSSIAAEVARAHGNKDINIASWVGFIREATSRAYELEIPSPTEGMSESDKREYRRLNVLMSNLDGRHSGNSKQLEMKRQALAVDPEPQQDRDVVENAYRNNQIDEAQYATLMESVESFENNRQAIKDSIEQIENDLVSIRVNISRTKDNINNLAGSRRYVRQYIDINEVEGDLIGTDELSGKFISIPTGGGFIQAAIDDAKALEDLNTLLLEADEEADTKILGAITSQRDEIRDRLPSEDLLQASALAVRTLTGSDGQLSIPEDIRNHDVQLVEGEQRRKVESFIKKIDSVYGLTQQASARKSGAGNKAAGPYIKFFGFRSNSPDSEGNFHFILAGGYRSKTLDISLGADNTPIVKKHTDGTPYISTDGLEFLYVDKSKDKGTRAIYKDKNQKVVELGVHNFESYYPIMINPSSFGEESAQGMTLGAFLVKHDGKYTLDGETVTLLNPAMDYTEGHTSPKLGFRFKSKLDYEKAKDRARSSVISGEDSQGVQKNTEIAMRQIDSIRASRTRNEMNLTDDLPEADRREAEEVIKAQTGSLRQVEATHNPRISNPEYQEADLDSDDDRILKKDNIRVKLREAITEKYSTQGLKVGDERIDAERLLNALEASYSIMDELVEGYALLNHYTSLDVKQVSEDESIGINAEIQRLFDRTKVLEGKWRDLYADRGEFEDFKKIVDAIGNDRGAYTLGDLVYSGGKKLLGLRQRQHTNRMTEATSAYIIESLLGGVRLTRPTRHEPTVDQMRVQLAEIMPNNPLISFLDKYAADRVLRETIESRSFGTGKAADYIIETGLDPAAAMELKDLRHYTIKKGDTYRDIARREGMDTWELLSLNGLLPTPEVDESGAPVRGIMTNQSKEDDIDKAQKKLDEAFEDDEVTTKLVLELPAVEAEQVTHLRSDAKRTAKGGKPGSELAEQLNLYQESPQSRHIKLDEEIDQLRAKNSPNPESEWDGVDITRLNNIRDEMGSIEVEIALDPPSSARGLVFGHLAAVDIDIDNKVPNAVERLQARSAIAASYANIFKSRMGALAVENATLQEQKKGKLEQRVNLNIGDEIIEVTMGNWRQDLRDHLGLYTHNEIKRKRQQLNKEKDGMPLLEAKEVSEARTLEEYLAKKGRGKMASLTAQMQVYRDQSGLSDLSAKIERTKRKISQVTLQYESAVVESKANDAAIESISSGHASEMISNGNIRTKDDIFEIIEELPIDDHHYIDPISGGQVKVTMPKEFKLMRLSPSAANKLIKDIEGHVVLSLTEEQLAQVKSVATTISDISETIAEMPEGLQSELRRALEAFGSDTNGLSDKVIRSSGNYAVLEYALGLFVGNRFPSSAFQSHFDVMGSDGVVRRINSSMKSGNTERLVQYVDGDYPHGVGREGYASKYLQYVFREFFTKINYIGTDNGNTIWSDMSQSQVVDERPLENTTKHWLAALKDRDQNGWVQYAARKKLLDPLWNPASIAGFSVQDQEFTGIDPDNRAARKADGDPYTLSDAERIFIEYEKLMDSEYTALRPKSGQEGLLTPPTLQGRGGYGTDEALKAQQVRLSQSGLSENIENVIGPMLNLTGSEPHKKTLMSTALLLDEAVLASKSPEMLEAYIQKMMDSGADVHNAFSRIILDTRDGQVEYSTAKEFVEALYEKATTVISETIEAIGGGKVNTNVLKSALRGETNHSPVGQYIKDTQGEDKLNAQAHIFHSAEPMPGELEQDGTPKTGAVLTTSDAAERHNVSVYSRMQSNIPVAPPIQDSMVEDNRMAVDALLENQMSAEYASELLRKIVTRGNVDEFTLEMAAMLSEVAALRNLPVNFEDWSTFKHKAYTKSGTFNKAYYNSSVRSVHISKDAFRIRGEDINAQLDYIIVHEIFHNVLREALTKGAQVYGDEGFTEASSEISKLFDELKSMDVPAEFSHQVSNMEEFFNSAWNDIRFLEWLKGEKPSSTGDGSKYGNFIDWLIDIFTKVIAQLRSKLPSSKKRKAIYEKTKILVRKLIDGAPRARHNDHLYRHDQITRSSSFNPKRVFPKIPGRGISLDNLVDGWAEKFEKISEGSAIDMKVGEVMDEIIKNNRFPEYNELLTRINDAIFWNNQGALLSSQAIISKSFANDPDTGSLITTPAMNNLSYMPVPVADSQIKKIREEDRRKGYAGFSYYTRGGGTQFIEVDGDSSLNTFLHEVIHQLQQPEIYESEHQYKTDFGVDPTSSPTEYLKYLKSIATDDLKTNPAASKVAEMYLKTLDSLPSEVMDALLDPNYLREPPYNHSFNYKAAQAVGLGYDTAYGLWNMHEFYTMSLTNPEMQELLSEVYLDRSSNVLSELQDAYTNRFDDISGTMLDLLFWSATSLRGLGIDRKGMTATDASLPLTERYSDDDVLLFSSEPNPEVTINSDENVAHHMLQELGGVNTVIQELETVLAELMENGYTPKMKPDDTPLGAFIREYGVVEGVPITTQLKRLSKYAEQVGVDPSTVGLGWGGSNVNFKMQSAMLAIKYVEIIRERARNNSVDATDAIERLDEEIKTLKESLDLELAFTPQRNGAKIKGLLTKMLNSEIESLERKGDDGALARAEELKNLRDSTSSQSITDILIKLVDEGKSDGEVSSVSDAIYDITSDKDLSEYLAQVLSRAQTHVSYMKISRAKLDGQDDLINEIKSYANMSRVALENVISKMSGDNVSDKLKRKQAETWRDLRLAEARIDIEKANSNIGKEINTALHPLRRRLGVILGDMEPFSLNDGATMIHMKKTSEGWVSGTYEVKYSDSKLEDLEKYNKVVGDNLKFLRDRDNKQYEKQPFYETVKKQTEAAVKVPTMKEWHHSRRASYFSVMQSLSQQFANMGLLGKTMSQMLNEVVRLHKAHDSYFKNQSFKWNRALKDAASELGYNDWQNLIEGPYNDALSWLDTHQELVDKESVAFERMWEYLSKSGSIADPSTMTSKAKRKFIALIKETNNSRKMLRDLSIALGNKVKASYKGESIKVESPVTGEMVDLFRDPIDLGPLTVARRLNKEFTAVVDILENMGWGDIQPYDDEIDYQTYLSKYISEDVIQRFIAPYAKMNSTTEPFKIAGQSLPQSLMRSTWNDTNGEGSARFMQWADLLSEKLNIDPKEVATQLFANYKEFHEELMRMHKATDNKDTFRITDSVTHKIMDGRDIRTAIPKEFWQYDTFDEVAFNIQLANVITNAVFGRGGDRRRGVHNGLHDQLQKKQAVFARLINEAGGQVNMVSYKPPMFIKPKVRREAESILASRGIKNPKQHFESLRSAASQYSQMRKAFNMMELYFGGKDGPYQDVRWLTEMLGFHAFLLLSQPKSSMLNFLSIPDIFVFSRGLNKMGLKGTAKALGNVLDQGFGGMFESMGIQVKKAHDYARDTGEMFFHFKEHEAPLRDQINLVGLRGTAKASFTDRSISGGLGPIPGVKGLSAMGRAQRAGVRDPSRQPLSLRTLLPLVGDPFGYAARVANHSIAFGLSSVYHDLVLEASKYIQKAGLEHGDEITAKDLGYGKGVGGMGLFGVTLDKLVLGGEEGWNNYNNKLIDAGLGSIADLAHDYLDRNKHGDRRVLTKDTTMGIGIIGLNEVALDGFLARPPWLYTSLPGRVAAPLLGWSLGRMNQINEFMRTGDGRLSALMAAKYMFLVGGSMLPVGLAMTLAQDLWDEEILGTPSALASISNTQAIPFVGMFINRDDPNYSPLAAIERIGRTSSPYGLLYDAVAQTIAFADPHSPARGFSLDSRVLVFSQINGFLNIIRNVASTRMTGIKDYTTFQRPLIYNMGGNAYIHYQKALTNLMGIDSEERRVSDIIGIKNTLRKGAKANGIPLRTAMKFGSAPTKLSIHVKQMERAAIANDTDDFRRAYVNAVSVARAEGRAEPEKYVIRSFKDRTLKRAVTARKISDEDWAKMLSGLDAGMREKIIKFEASKERYANLISPPVDEPPSFRRQSLAEMRRRALGL